VWRKQVNNKAANLGYKGLNSPMGEDDDSEKLDGDGPGAFAYSPLPATEYQDANDSTYPGGGSATYTGETVALQPDGDGAVIYTGLIEVTAEWDAAWTPRGADGADIEPTDTTTVVDTYKLGLVTAVISSLETPEGDSLEYITITSAELADDTKTRDVMETGNKLMESGEDIQEIIFRDVSITTPADEEKNTLSFRTEFTNTGEMARIVTDVGANPMDLDVTEVGGRNAASLVGTFVGQDVDGPLGVIGRWTLMDSATATDSLDTITRVRDEDGDITHRKTYSVNIDDEDTILTGIQHSKIGTGAMIYGAFGAEVEP
jgi:hypothetical protein